MTKNIIYRQCFRTKKCTFVLEANLYGAEMEFETLKRKGKFLLLDEGVALRRIPVGLTEQEEEVHDAHSLIVVLHGEMGIVIDGNKQRVASNYFLDILEKHPFAIVSTSYDLSAYQLLLTKKFMDGLFKNTPPFPSSYLFEKMKNPVYVFPAGSIELFYRHMEALEKIIRDTDSNFRPAKFKCALWLFLLDVADAYLHMEKQVEKNSDENDRQRQITNQFIEFLQLHIYEGHTANFYAEKLCITPQYLNRVLKNQSGHTTYEWITRTLLGEIIKQLKDTITPVQLLADMFNFPDQSSFTKFFKRHTGMTPTQYRKEKI